MKKSMIKEQAEKLIHDFGDAAYQNAQEAARDAHRRRNSRFGTVLGGGCTRGRPVRASVAIGDHAPVLGQQIGRCTRNCIVTSRDLEFVRALDHAGHTEAVARGVNGVAHGGNGSGQNGEGATAPAATR